MDNGAFTGLTNLKALYLNHNKLQSLPADIFRGLEKLEYLDLSWNRMTNLSGGNELFHDLVNLKSLYPRVRIQHSRTQDVPRLAQLEILMLYTQLHMCLVIHQKNRK